MVQRKKGEVRDAILSAAFQLFSEKGYSETTVPQIAKLAGVSNANVYVYYPSKLQIMLALYRPWLEERLDKIDRSLKRTVDPKQRLQKLLRALWRDLPREHNGFAHNIVEAVASSSGRSEYDPSSRQYYERRVAEWLQKCAELSSKEAGLVSTVMIMAFDGFAANVTLDHGAACNADMVELFADLLSRPSAQKGLVEA